MRLRAWDKKNKRWTSVVDFGGNARAALQLMIETNLDLGKTLDDVEWVVSTGKRDKSGKEIWESDVVWDPRWGGQRVVICWGFHSDHSSYKNQLGFNIWEEDLPDMIILGNIYEHPELVSHD